MNTTNINEIVADYKQKKNILVQSVTTALQRSAIDIFDKYPKLKSFGFQAYTPYFNDGEECAYSVRHDRWAIMLNDAPNHDHHTEDMMFNEAESVSEFLSQISDDIYLDLFGDHKQITFMRDGVTIQDYTDHD